MALFLGEGVKRPESEARALFLLTAVFVGFYHSSLFSTSKRGAQRED
jgi:hypothetical protein